MALLMRSLKVQNKKIYLKVSTPEVFNQIF